MSRWRNLTLRSVRQALRCTSQKAGPSAGNYQHLGDKGQPGTEVKYDTLYTMDDKKGALCYFSGKRWTEKAFHCYASVILIARDNLNPHSRRDPK